MLLEQDLAGVRGPVLSDGVALGDLVDFDRRRVSMRVLHDPEIHRLELKRIFARSWVGVAVASEIPEPGDFVLSSIGEDAVIVTRTRDDDVAVLLNACAHRGMEVCWADAGNQASFKCPYHGWVFDGDGSLLGAPFEKEMYGDWDKSQYGLRRARVTVKNGIVYACFDESAPTLEEYVGDLAWYLDIAQSGAQREILGPPARWLIEADWKVLADQGVGDAYHGLTLHRALQELGFVPDMGILDHVKISFPPHGHSVFSFDTVHDGVYGLDRDFTAYLFPGTSYWANRAMPMADGSILTYSTFARLLPRGLGRFEVCQQLVVDAAMPEQQREIVRKIGLLTTGLGVTDDMEQGPSMQRIAQGAVGRESWMTYPAISGPNRPADWSGPGLVYAGPSRDDAQWDFWVHWFSVMTADER